MIPVAPSLSEIDELPAEQEVEFTIGDARWVMRALADLYSNREYAVAREYSTNARDANIVADKADVPIEVSLPSAFDPYFVVRDFGEGMPLETLTEVYTSFGVSTKRESKDENGMLGFGCKAAIAYTNSFTVTSINRGKKVIAVISRKPDYTITMKVVRTSLTDEPSGTEVRVPVHNVDEFRAKANEFYKFWKVGTVLVDGKAPEQFVGQEIVSGMYHSPEYGTSYVVMGGVPYRIENPRALFDESRMRFNHFIAYVDNGDVEFTPSREDLKYTPHTVNTLKRIVKDYADLLLTNAKAEIDAATTHIEALDAWDKWTRLLGPAALDDLEFQGDKFERRFEIIGTRYAPFSNPANRSIREWDVLNMRTTMIVTDFNLSLSTRHRRVARDYLALKGISANYILFTSADDVKSPWVDRSRFVRWDDMDAAVPKPVRVSTPRRSRLGGTWDYADKNGYHVEETLKGTEKIFWVSTDEYKRYDIVGLLETLAPDHICLKVYANRIAKFKRDNPTAQNLMKYAKSKVIKDEASLISDDIKSVMSLSTHSRRLIAKLDVRKVKDSRFAAMRKILDTHGEVYSWSTYAPLAAVQRNHDLANMCKATVDYWTPSGKSFIDECYPLINCTSVVDAHVYIYINAVYNHFNESTEGDNK